MIDIAWKSHADVSKAEAIIAAAEKETNITDYINGNRSSHLVAFRNVCMYLIRKNTRFSYAQIGGMFSKDHATAMHACKSINNILDLSDKIGQHKFLLTVNDKLTSRAYSFLFSYLNMTSSDIAEHELERVEARVRQLLMTRRALKNLIRNK